MTKELFDKYALKWNKYNGEPLLDEEQFYKAMFDYREWLLSQTPIAGQVKPQVIKKVADGCTCQNCGNKYKVDYLIPDDLWLKISPKKSEAGLLCGVCITRAIEYLNGYKCFELKQY